MTKLHEIVESIQSGHFKSELPEIRVGDLVRVGVSIQEGINNVFNLLKEQ